LTPPLSVPTFGVNGFLPGVEIGAATTSLGPVTPVTDDELLLLLLLPQPTSPNAASDATTAIRSLIRRWPPLGSSSSLSIQHRSSIGDYTVSGRRFATRASIRSSHCHRRRPEDERDPEADEAASRERAKGAHEALDRHDGAFVGTSYPPHTRLRHRPGMVRHAQDEKGGEHRMRMLKSLVTTLLVSGALVGGGAAIANAASSSTSTTSTTHSTKTAPSRHTAPSGTTHHCPNMSGAANTPNTPNM
jgi:hypothetical protein